MISITVQTFESCRSNAETFSERANSSAGGPTQSDMYFQSFILSSSKTMVTVGNYSSLLGDIRLWMEAVAARQLMHEMKGIP